jgi:hypothetical protein
VISMIDYNILETIVIVAFTLLIFDTGLGLLMKMRLLHKCRVTCESDDE